ncbi:hypothetical protein CCHR01_08161 [Colletotrichum chrysophilum]|uniref:Uncharacterized protein n=1 Tax=Colletotrichum chrysophilum TaxID=1836956 RepID=A0AAD9EF89_9PEZI|nr:hypothetical protein CCHR01_08161 [Colletotrichum chrysophilum]
MKSGGRVAILWGKDHVDRRHPCPADLSRPESSFNSSVHHCRVANIPSVRGNVPGSSAFCSPVPGAMFHGHSSAAT